MFAFFVELAHHVQIYVWKSCTKVSPVVRDMCVTKCSSSNYVRSGSLEWGTRWPEASLTLHLCAWTHQVKVQLVLITYVHVCWLHHLRAMCMGPSGRSAVWRVVFTRPPSFFLFSLLRIAHDNQNPASHSTFAHWPIRVQHNLDLRVLACEDMRP
jgi:hypothetical protein